jgi:hypothetical protein
VKVKKEVTGRLIFQQKEQGKWHILKMTQKTMAWNQERTRVVKTYKHSCHSILSLRPREKKDNDEDTIQNKHIHHCDSLHNSVGDKKRHAANDHIISY